MVNNMVLQVGNKIHIIGMIMLSDDNGMKSRK